MPPEVAALVAPITEAPPPPAPIPAAEPPLTAAEQAVVAKDPVAFKAARHAERFPSPEKPVVAAPVPEKPAVPDNPPVAEVPPVAEPPARQLSKEQEKANERTRRAIDNATADIRRENAELRARLAGLAPPPVAPRQPEADPEPDFANVEKYPNGQFDVKFVKDLASWQTRQDLKAHDERSAAHVRQSEEVASFNERAGKTRTILETAIAADPKALDDIDPALMKLTPSIGVAAKDLTFGHVIADWLTDTAYPVQLLKHLSDRAEQDRLSNLSDAALLREQGRIEAGFAKPATPPPAPAPPAKIITEAPDPAVALGHRPLDAPDALQSAVRNKDQAAYSAEKRARDMQHYAG